jgi:hypothetical protein
MPELIDFNQLSPHGPNASKVQRGASRVPTRILRCGLGPFPGPKHEYGTNKADRDSSGSDCNRGDLFLNRRLDTVSDRYVFETGAGYPRIQTMTGDQSRLLNPLDRVWWENNPADLGTVVRTTWSEVTISWDDGYTTSIQHNDMAQVGRALRKTLAAKHDPSTEPILALVQE